MADQPTRVTETITLGQAKSLIKAMAHQQSLLLLSPPGVGKSESVYQAATDEGLPCRSLLGTQIAPEDVSGIPHIVGERSVFCPPRILLPEDPQQFCLFLDELPACAPDIQKAFYSLLLERRIGEHRLPAGSWVVAAGNRAEDRAMVRSLSSALVNRVIILHIRVDFREWMHWATRNAVRDDIKAFISFMPEALMRAVPSQPVPFSTPRAWVALSRALDLADAAGLQDPSARRALAFGSVSPEDAAIYCALAEAQVRGLPGAIDCIVNPGLLPKENTALWFLLCRIRRLVTTGELQQKGIPAEVINRFLLALTEAHRFSLLLNLVEQWGALGASEALLTTLREFAGL